MEVRVLTDEEVEQLKAEGYRVFNLHYEGKYMVLYPPYKRVRIEDDR